MTFTTPEGQPEWSDKPVPPPKALEIVYKGLMGDHYDPGADPGAMDRLAMEVMADVMRYKKPDIPDTLGDVE